MGSALGPLRTLNNDNKSNFSVKTLLPAHLQTVYTNPSRKTQLWCKTMNALLIGLNEERKEAVKLIKIYGRKLRALPKGTFFVRKVGDSVYGYVTHSVAGDIRQKYIGKVTSEQIKIQKDLAAQKKKLKSLIKQTQHQLRFLERSLSNARKKG